MKPMWKSLLCAAIVLPFAYLTDPSGFSMPVAAAQSSTVQRTPQTLPPSVPVRSMGPANVARAQAQLNALIRQLQHDPNSYAGHRDKAVQLLIQAQQELVAAGTTPQAQPN